MDTFETDAGALLAAERAIGEVLLVARDGGDAFVRGMGATAPWLGWTAACLWVPGRSGTPRIAAQWPAPAPGEQAAAGAGLERVGLRAAAAATGAAAVFADGTPRWFGDPAGDPDVVDGAALAADGVCSGVWFPLEGASRTVAVVEAYWPDLRPPAADVEATLISLGRRVGQFVEHHRALRGTEHSEARKRAILDAALDAVITIDEEGRVVEANAALERVFGFDAAEAVGREMAELIVPPELRGRHRDGLRRLVGGGDPRLLGRRIELEAMRADGSRLPVELTVTRIDLPGRPMFTGHVRDITAVHEARDALRASRVRVVEASDEARRRIERDLHDGAQQRLVALGLTLRLAEQQAARDAAAASELLAEAREDLAEAISELRELARGIHPAILTDAGLDAAVAGLVRRSPVPVEARLDVGRRLPAVVEAAAYFTIAEAFANIARHSEATSGRIAMGVADGELRFCVSDDGRGGASLEDGSGLRGLVDRLEAVGGRLTVRSAPGEGTTLEGTIPAPV
jgi:PAS domain S-box-containing protein